MGIAAALLRLREKAIDLNAITSAATRALSVVERFLDSKGGVGVSASVPLSIPGFPKNLELIFGRYKGRHRIYIQTDVLNSEGESICSPWEEAPREVKIHAASHLSELIEALSREVDQQSQKANVALPKLKEVWESLELLEGKSDEE